MPFCEWTATQPEWPPRLADIGGGTADSSNDRGIAQCNAALSLQQDYFINPPALEVEGVAPEEGGRHGHEVRTNRLQQFPAAVVRLVGAGAGHAAEVFDHPA